MTRGRILADVQSGSQNKLTSSKTVVILGKFIYTYTHVNNTRQIFGWSFYITINVAN